MRKYISEYHYKTLFLHNKLYDTITCKHRKCHMKIFESLNLKFNYISYKVGWVAACQCKNEQPFLVLKREVEQEDISNNHVCCSPLSFHAMWVEKCLKDPFPPDLPLHSASKRGQFRWIFVLLNI